MSRWDRAKSRNPLHYWQRSGRILGRTLKPTMKLGPLTDRERQQIRKILESAKGLGG
jgi:hypothetical protein